MSQALARFVRALDRLGRGVSAFELLDALLIAPHLGLNTASPKARPHEPQRPQPTSSTEPDPPPVAEPPPADSPPDVPIESAGAKQGGERPAVAVRLPAGGPPLRGRQFARALRGFHHRVPSRVRWELDEDGTVQLRAETRLPLVRLRAVRERAITLCLVIDRTASMEVWADTVRALVRTALGAGVFRAVRLLKVDTDGPSPAVGRWCGTLHTKTIRPPSGVGTVVVVVSDLCSRAWWNGSAFRLFAKWNRLVPVGLVGLMPENLKRRTALGERRLLPLVRPAPAGPIHMLSLPGYEDGDVLPVGTLDPKAVSALAGMLGHNHSTVRGVGVWVPVDEDTSEESPAVMVEDPAVIVRQFLATASPQAVRLAGLLALFNSPTARTLRLVRGAAGLNTEPSHEAEVLLGGLMRGERRTVNGRPAWEYKFHDGVQAELVSRATWGDTEPRRFFDRFHSYLERRKCELNGIRAAIPTTGDATIRGLEDQFLSLSATTLAALGPRAADLSRLLGEVRQAEAARELYAKFEEKANGLHKLADTKTRLGDLSTTGSGKTSSINTFVAAQGFPRKPTNLRLNDELVVYGQDDFLRSLRAGVTGGVARQVLCDGNGVSKTHLTDCYARMFADDYTALLYLNVRSPDWLRDGLASLTDPRVLDLPEHVSTSVEERAGATERWLSENAGWLLILDNADTPEVAPPILALARGLRHGHLLVTSRSSAWWPKFTTFDVQPPASAAAARFLLDKTAGRREPHPTDESDAIALADALGGIGLNRAAQVIVAVRISVREYLRRWHAAGAEVDRFRPPEAKYPPRMAALWLVSFDSLSVRAQHLQQVLSWFAPLTIPARVLVAPEGKWAVAELDELAHFSMLFRRTTDDSFVLTWSIIQVTQDWMSGERRQESVRLAVRVLERAMLTESEGGDARGLFAQLESHMQAVCDRGESRRFRKEVQPLRTLLQQARLLIHAGEPVRFSPQPQALLALRPLKEYAPGMVVTGRVVGRLSTGLEVEFEGRKAYMPPSQVDIGAVDLDLFVGSTIECQIDLVDEGRGRIVVSRRKLLEARRRRDESARLLESLEPGQTRQGVVTRLKPYGAVVDLGGVEGLVHVSEMAWNRVSDPSSVVQLHQRLDVSVLSVDRDNNRVQLSLRRLTPDPWVSSTARFPVGSRHEGVVSNVMSYGAFVDLAEGVSGLVHLSELSATRRVKHPSEVLQVGERVTVEVIGQMTDKRGLALSIRRVLPDPWADTAAKYPVGKPVSGVVRHITSYGAFVEVEAGVDALLHVNDMSWLHQVTDPRGLVQVGQTVMCVVTRVEPENKRMALSLKHMTPDPWEKEIPAKYTPGQLVRAVVESVTEHGILVTLPDGMRVSMPISELSEERIRHPQDVVKVGDLVRVKVLQLNAAERTIVLTLRSVSTQPRAFICYASADSEFVTRLKAWLVTQGWDWWEYKSGEQERVSLHRELGRRIEQTSVVLFVLSPHWFKSSDCRGEWNTAAGLRKEAEYLVVRKIDPRPLQESSYSSGRLRIDFTSDEANAFSLLADRLRQISSQRDESPPPA